jgi:hypothetical protein
VSCGGATATNVIPVSDTELRVQSPAGTGTVPVSVASPEGTSQPVPAAQFT